MKTKITSLCLALSFYAALSPAKTQPKPADFSGKWALDTSQPKNLPQGLKAYSMVVSQDAKQLKIETSIQGDLRPAPRLDGPYPGGGPRGTNYPAGQGNGVPGRGGIGLGRMGRIGGMGMPGGGERPMGEGMPVGGMPADGVGGRSGGAGGDKSHATIAAFSSYPRRAVFELDGSKTSAQLGGPRHASATLKATWAKSKQVLKMSADANDNSGMGGDILLKDQWKLSKDGRSLIVDRAVHSKRGSGTVRLIFHKQPVGGTNNAT